MRSQFSTDAVDVGAVELIELIVLVELIKLVELIQGELIDSVAAPSNTAEGCDD
jgi:hypothetical protein